MSEQSEAPVGLRERKKRETRVALSQATIRLCVLRGWDAVTVEDIAAAADVSVRTFRNYFSGKAEAIAAGHLERMLQVADELRGRPVDEPLWDSVAHAVQARFAPQGGTGAATVDQERRWTDGVRLMLAEPALQGELAKANAVAEQELAKAIAERTGTDPAVDVYPRLVAAVIGAGSAVAVEHCLRQEPPAPLAPMLREVFDRVAAGLPAG
ncbi:TetR family transcriptional regulator [Kitasatospora sp. LaBMicrA B282]|uniref:acyl-CoA-like ligand-binding transcription factor n=1 Tax=Kitasatospora sp. LaBMicrA B282 TaxID=3420949 RepID=UPI003D11B737